MSGRLRYPLALALCLLPALCLANEVAVADDPVSVMAAEDDASHDLSVSANDDELQDAVQDAEGNVYTDQGPIAAPAPAELSRPRQATDRAAARERIEQFDIDLKLDKNGDLLISERLTVNVTNDKIRHGIRRDIPTVYSLPYGLVRKAPIELLETLRDGQPEPVKKSYSRWGISYYLGSPDEYVEPGRHVYQLRYRMNALLHSTASKDELYWNLTGNEWEFPIQQVTARIELPDGARIDQMTGYTGPAGTTDGRDYQVLQRGDNLVTLATTRTFAAQEGFTVALDWQAGVIQRPNALMRTAKLLWDNLGVVIGVLAVLGLFAYYYHWWRRVGRDPAKGIIVPRYEAPKLVSPARAGYVWNEGFSQHFSNVEALTVTDLARRKALSIADAPRSTAFILSKGTPPTDLQPHEQELLKELFASKDEVRVGAKYVKALDDALSAHSEKLREWGDSLFSKNRKPWYLGIVGALLAFGAIGVLNDPIILFALFPLIFIAVGFGMIKLGWDNLMSSPPNWVGLVLIFFGLPFALGGVGTAVAMLWSTSLYVPICLFLLLAQIILFRRWLEAPTVEGRQVLDALEGYRDYLQLAESDVLARAADAPAMSIAQYERHLPYAMALGVEQQWTARFSAAVTAGVIELSEPDYRPDWYRHSSRFTSASAFSSALVAAASSASTPPPSPSSGASSSSGSSSSSGGGSSGGGGGGGGGGGW